MNVNGKKTSGRHIMKCLKVSLDFIYYNGEPLKVFKEEGIYWGRTDWHDRIMTAQWQEHHSQLDGMQYVPRGQRNVSQETGIFLGILNKDTYYFDPSG